MGTGDLWPDVLRIGLGVLGGVGFFGVVVLLVTFYLRDKR